MDHRLVLRQQITAEATALGFDLVGITSAEPLAHGGRLCAWGAQGVAGEMGYMSRDVEKRLEPSRVLPDVRSIIVLGMNYYTSPTVPETSPGHGWISRYAWGQDYHTVLGDKLKALVAFIKTIEGPDVQARWYVDTGPILERELACRGGRGGQVWGGQVKTLT